MGWLQNVKDAIMARIPSRVYYAGTMNGSTPIYSAFGRDIYASDVVTQATACVTDEIKKLAPAHVIARGMDIEPVGAFNVRDKRPDATLIFIVPPSQEELENRLRGRGDTPEEQVRTRLERARWEIDQAPKYDYQVVNDMVDTCVEEVLKIIADKAD